jgi:hypothetical protein
MAATNAALPEEAREIGHALGDGRSLAATMPRLILEARRVAATVIHGLHGRRRAGPGENFRPPASTGVAPRVTTISMCASTNGRPPIRCGCGPTARLR